METREQRIERMGVDNPGKTPELCTVVVDKMWDEKKAALFDAIPEMFKDASVGNLGYMEKIVLDAWEKILDPKDRAKGIIFCGNPGAGKTYAAYAFVKWLAEKNPEVVSLVMGYPDAIQKLRKEFANDQYNEAGSVWEKLRNGSFIVLDDVSSQKPTDFEIDKFLSIMDHRMNNYLPFLLTTNIKADNFADVFGDRLASRLWGFSTIIEFEDSDKRI